jgi:hypothetical protein
LIRDRREAPRSARAVLFSSTYEPLCADVLLVNDKVLIIHKIWRRGAPEADSLPPRISKSTAASEPKLWTTDDACERAAEAAWTRLLHVPSARGTRPTQPRSYNERTSDRPVQDDTGVMSGATS